MDIRVEAEGIQGKFLSNDVSCHVINTLTLFHYVIISISSDPMIMLDLITTVARLRQQHHLLGHMMSKLLLLKLRCSYKKYF